MKIAILADPIDGQYAGIHVYTKELVRAVLNYDKKNEYILIRQKKGNEFPGVKQVVIPNLPVYTGFQVLRFFFIFPVLLRRLKVDAVLEPAHFGPFNLPKKIKRITVIHDLTPIFFPELHRFYSQMLQRIFLKRILKKADLILTNSDNTTQDTIKYYPGAATKTKRIYLGKDKLFKPSFDKTTIDKYKLDEAYFLYTGTIEPRKNLMVLLKAFAIFKKSYTKPIKLLIVGKRGWKSQAVFDELENHPNKNDIQLLGYVPRAALPVLYSNTMAFIYPSVYEGFGLPVLEAMACGAPCIVSDSSSLPEVGGVAALYFPPADPNALADQMIKLAGDENLRESLKGKSLKQAEGFSWELYARQFMALMAKIN